MKKILSASLILLLFVPTFAQVHVDAGTTTGLILGIMAVGVLAVGLIILALITDAFNPD